MASKDENNIILINKVGSGFNEEDFKTLEDELEIIDPEIAKQVYVIDKFSPDVFYKAKVVIEVSFDSYTFAVRTKKDDERYKKQPKFSLRFPVFVRMRKDKSLNEITSYREMYDASQKHFTKFFEIK